MLINSSWLATSSVPLSIAYLLSFAVLLIGSITDLKTREVPDFVNYGFIISGVALNILFSVIYSDFSFAVHSAIGLLIFFCIAYVMFYAGQWGGGDSKMLMGIGAMIGIDVFFRKPQLLLGFFVNVLFAGALYGLLWSAFLAFKNRKSFRKMKLKFRKLFSRRTSSTTRFWPCLKSVIFQGSKNVSSSWNS